SPFPGPRGLRSRAMPRAAANWAPSPWPSGPDRSFRGACAATFPGGSMKRSLVLAAALATLVAPFGAVAHKAWLRPSQTVLAGNDPWITVDAAVSNDLFYFNHVPIRLDNLVI